LFRRREIPEARGVDKTLEGSGVVVHIAYMLSEEHADEGEEEDGYEAVEVKPHPHKPTLDVLSWLQEQVVHEQQVVTQGPDAVVTQEQQKRLVVP
jgi:hypothetical protein